MPSLFVPFFLIFLSRPALKFTGTGRRMFKENSLNRQTPFISRRHIDLENPISMVFRQSNFVPFNFGRNENQAGQQSISTVKLPPIRIRICFPAFCSGNLIRMVGTNGYFVNVYTTGDRYENLFPLILLKFPQKDLVGSIRLNPISIGVSDRPKLTTHSRGTSSGLIFINASLKPFSVQRVRLG